ncbi:MAG: universal stress protein [Acidobacteriia bacterium]|nr:universal stress protein [Terriglobia bacterium]
MKTTSRVNDKVGFRNVLFATDFSAAAMQALPYATGIARRFGSKLYVAHIVPPEDYPSGLSSSEEAARAGCRQAEPNLNSVLNSALCRGLSCQALIGDGDIWIGLSNIIRQHAADLLVMGTIGRRGVGKVLLGSVAEEAMRESRCPVLTIGPESHSAEESGFERILYATDFSTDSLAAVPYALAFVKKYNSRIVLVHALEHLPESPYLDAQMARVHLRDLVSQRANLVAEPEIIVEMGSAADVILKAADHAASDLIVIGARGAGAFARLASHFGSVAHKIVCRAACPVLTVRPLHDRDKEQ